MKSINDWLTMRVTGLWVLISGIVGLVYTIRYDFNLHREMVLGINAKLGIVYCVLCLIIRVANIKSWSD